MGENVSSLTHMYSRMRIRIYIFCFKQKKPHKRTAKVTNENRRKQKKRGKKILLFTAQKNEIVLYRFLQ